MNAENALTLSDVVEQIDVNRSAPTDPVNLASELDFVSLWVREHPDRPERARARIRLLGPTGQELQSAVVGVDLSRHTRHRTIARISGLPVAGPGTHTLALELADSSGGWEPAGSFEFEVRFRDDDATPTAP